jgi:hypothetical protein
VKQRLVGLALAFVTVIAVMVNQRDVGIARDEVVYMSAGKSYAHWWLGGFGPIEKTWGGPLGGANNPEHPPFV